MIEETYLKEYHDFEGDDVCVVSFEGDKKSIERLRDCAKKLNDNEHDMLIQWLKENAKPLTITEDKKDMVNHPSHYTDDNGMECIDEMMLVFGEEAVAHFCLCNVWKYRHRAVYKNGVEDKLKSDWYMAKYKELKEQIKRNRAGITLLNN